MKERFISDRLVKTIDENPATVLLGARQVGKTTLARMIGKNYDSLYLDLESPADIRKLDDAIGFLSSHKDKLIILDEIQRAPELFQTLRGLIDENRFDGKATGQFLLLGSASMDLLKQTSESLAGRISYVEMTGFNALEVSDRDIEKLWFQGGFPSSYLASSNDVALDWLEDFIRTYLERDVPQAGFNIPPNRMRNLWTMLAHRQGETIEQTKLATNLQVSAPTVKNHIDILVNLLLVRALNPWHKNTEKRVVKSPRYYVRDSGVLHRLLEIPNYDALLGNTILGKSWEGFVIENIHSVLPKRSMSYFYRTSAGAEIDLVICLPNSDVWAVEIKYGDAPNVSVKNFSRICGDVGATAKYVIYGGKEEYSSGDVIFIPLVNFLQRLSAYSILAVPTIKAPLKINRTCCII